MADVIFVAIVIAFFALMVALVRACDTIVGPDTATHVDETGSAEPIGEKR